MNPLFKAFLDLCLFRTGPQGLPTSIWLRNATLVGYFLVSAALSISIAPEFNSLLAALLDTFFLALLVVGSLWLVSKRERINQTLTAIYGSGVLFNLAIAPFAVIYLSMDKQAGPLLATGITALGLWNLAVLGNILRHALNLPLIAGMAIAITYLALSSLLVR
ncbi:hypothetical protein MNBD_GAMMA18-1186 [hydrothermal vent metagenome]|uniref:Yip1 domain-containing protein n=1 Tax=hydrothermal vent metagenome TaxID=652676 RepID=A0A3B0YSS7_9ZZZZ